MKSKGTKAFILGLIIVAVCALMYFALPTMLSALAPFILAYFLSLALEPLIRVLNVKLRVPRAIAAGICTLLAVGVIGALLTWLGVHLWTQAVELSMRWPSIYAEGKAYFLNLFAWWQDYYESLSPQIQGYVDYGFAEVRNSITSLLSPIAKGTVNFANRVVAGVPSAIIFVIVTFLACNFMCAEKRKMRALLVRIFGLNTVRRINGIWKDLRSALGGYIKAQLAIMCVSCTILLIGFTIAGVPFTLLLAVSVAILDALPVFGSGAVLIPWSIFALVSQDFKMMAIVLAMYIIIIISRQMLEPRILGKHIGVPPLLTLMSMYIGLKVFGIFGMVIGPVIVLIVKNLYVGGIFDRFLKSEEEIEKQEKTDKKEESKPEKEVQDHE